MSRSLPAFCAWEGFINSRAGNKGGYVLARPAQEININQALKSLGGALFDSQFCGVHAGGLNLCTNSVDCSARSLWKNDPVPGRRIIGSSLSF
jgi:DNA-binding IscR family transcriptional regulator